MAGTEEREGGEKDDSHLRGVQFVFANNFDSDFASGLAFNRLVHVGESAVAHLFNELEFLQALGGCQDTSWHEGP